MRECQVTGLDKEFDSNKILKGYFLVALSAIINRGHKALV